MNKQLKLALLSALVLGLSACNSDGSKGPNIGIDEGKPKPSGDISADFQQQKKNAEQKKQEVEGQVAAMQAKLSTARQGLQVLENQDTELTKNIKQKNEEINQVANEIESVTEPEKKQELIEKQNQLNTELKALNAERQQVEEQMESAQQEVNLASNEYDNLQKQLAMLEKNIEDIDAKIALAPQIIISKQLLLGDRKGTLDDDPNESIIKSTIVGQDKNGQALPQNFKDLSQLKQGLSAIDVVDIIEDNNKKVTYESKSKYFVYNLDYSAIVADNVISEKVIIRDGKAVSEKEIKIGDMGLVGFAGLNTTTEQLAKLEGKASYVGDAYAMNKNSGDLEKGQLNYSINFVGTSAGSGSGSITGLKATGDITLKEAKLIPNYSGGDHHYEHLKGQVALEGKADSSNFQDANYTVGVYGPRANEIMGVINPERDAEGHVNDIIFGGKQTGFQK